MCFDYKICGLIFSIILSETFLILGKIQRDAAINVDGSECKVPIIPVRFQ
jgi:hypothetical protein